MRKFNPLRIRGERKSRNIKAEEVAELIGVKVVAYRCRESGKTATSVDELVKIADFFKIENINIFFE